MGLRTQSSVLGSACANPLLSLGAPVEAVDKTALVELSHDVGMLAQVFTLGHRSLMLVGETVGGGVRHEVKALLLRHIRNRRHQHRGLNPFGLQSGETVRG